MEGRVAELKMKRFFYYGGGFFFFVFVGALFFPAIIFAQSGGIPGQFMAYGAGARALGMGGAFFAIADDATASYWNPAAMVMLERKEFSSMQANLFAKTSLSFLTYANPTPTRGTWAVNVTQLQCGGFEKIAVQTNSSGDEIIGVSKLGSFSNTERAVGFSWGRDVSDKVSFGFMVKSLQRSLDTSSDNFQSVDLAMLRRFSSVYRLAFGIQNAVTIKSGDTDDKLPVILKVGNALSLFKGRLIFGFDVAKPQSADMNWRFGGEYWLMNWWGLRFGMLGAPGLQEADFGFGLRYRSLGLDIAQGIHDLGTTTRFSFSVKLGESYRAEHSREVRDVIEQGMQAFKAGNFIKTVEKFQAAIDADPGNAEIKRMLGRLQGAVSYVPEAVGAEESATLIRRGIIGYVEGKDSKTAVNALRHAFNKNPKSDNLLSLLNTVEREAGVSEMTRKPEGPEIFTFIDQKIYDARQAVYDGKYDLAIRRAQDVLDLEPSNETALEIMGSAFLLMDQKAKAKMFWNKALEINPKNGIVREFLKQIE